MNENLLSIGEHAFEGSRGFAGNLVIPDKVQTIGEQAFYGCRGWRGNLIVGKSVTSLDTYAFAYLENSPNSYRHFPLFFAKVYFKGMIPPSSASNAFSTYYRNLTYVAVPIGCKDVYMTAFSNKINVIEEIEF